MGSRQKAVDDFIAVCEDATMLDRWIPDEDWVRKIRVGKADLRCLIANLNMGLSKQCGFQNNHAILQGRTIFHNKRKIRWPNTKVSNISFYYVLSPGMQAPTIPSDEVFYQSLWDVPSRQNRALKQIAPSVTPRPTKKAKASSTRPSPPELSEAASGVTSSTTPSRPPQSSVEAGAMNQKKGEFEISRLILVNVG
jgi:hypothetical protein